jgi:hypothetical protein
MLIFSILILLSNAVNPRRDFAILYNRIAILFLLYCTLNDFSLLLLTKNRLYENSLLIGNVTEFHFCIFILCILILVLTSFYPRIIRLSDFAFFKHLVSNRLRTYILNLAALMFAIISSHCPYQKYIDIYNQFYSCFININLFQDTHLDINLVFLIIGSLLILIYPRFSSYVFKFNFYITSKFTKSVNNKVDYNKYASYLMFLLFFCILIIIRNFCNLVLISKLVYIDFMFLVLYIIVIMVLMLIRHYYVIFKIFTRIYYNFKADPCYFISSRLTLIICMKYILLVTVLFFPDSEHPIYLYMVGLLFYNSNQPVNAMSRYIFAPVIFNVTDDAAVGSGLQSNDYFNQRVKLAVMNKTGISWEEVNSRFSWEDKKYEYLGGVLDVPRIEGRELYFLHTRPHQPNSLFFAPLSNIVYVQACSTSDKIGVYEKVSSFELAGLGPFALASKSLQKNLPDQCLKFIATVNAIKTDYPFLVDSSKAQNKPFNPYIESKAKDLSLVTNTGDTLSLHQGPANRKVYDQSTCLGKLSEVVLCQRNIQSGLMVSIKGDKADLENFYLAKFYNKKTGS